MNLRWVLLNGMLTQLVEPILYQSITSVIKMRHGIYKHRGLLGDVVADLVINDCGISN